MDWHTIQRMLIDVRDEDDDDEEEETADGLGSGEIEVNDDNIEDIMRKLEKFNT